MDEDPFSGCGLRPVELTDQATLDAYFKFLGHSLAEPLSDYTFSQLFTWRNSLRLLWTILDHHLCVFANGSGDLTLLLPPIGDSAGSGSGDRALRQSFEIMDAYNVAHGVPDRSRVEYASEAFLARFDCSRVSTVPMGADYVYDIRRMIDLAGGDLASKRQAKNRFLRNYVHRVEPYETARHYEECCLLLENWRDHQDVAHVFDGTSNSLKRQKESLATELALRHSAELGLTGLVVYVNDPESPDPAALSLRGFTFGEPLGSQQSSIVIEKTDLRIKGLAQFIFSDFCQRYWSHLPLVNVGDDWGLETLAWTKQSYRPVKLLQKFVMTPAARVAVAIGPSGSDEIGVAADAMADQTSDIATTVILREARKDDVAAALELEESCFSSNRITRRQLQYLQNRPSALFLVAEQNDRVVAEAIALIRHHKTGKSGRIYSLAVAPESRGQKLGSRLMNRIIAELESRGVKRVYLEVERGNTAAIRLYERLGFRAIGLLPDYYSKDNDALHMMYAMCDAAQEPTLFDSTLVLSRNKSAA